MKFSRPGSDQGVHASSVVRGTDGAYVIFGTVFDSATIHSWGWVAKVDQTGKRVWEREFGKNRLDSGFYAAVAMPGGGVVLGGKINRSPPCAETAPGWVVSLNAAGRVVWDKAMSLGMLTLPRAMTTLSNGDLVILGLIEKPDPSESAEEARRRPMETRSHRDIRHHVPPWTRG